MNGLSATEIQYARTLLGRGGFNDRTSPLKLQTTDRCWIHPNLKRHNDLQTPQRPWNTTSIARSLFERQGFLSIMGTPQKSLEPSQQYHIEEVRPPLCRETLASRTADPSFSVR